MLSHVDLCGRARRVFVNNGRAYVLGLVGMTIIDVADPASPVVLQRLRFIVRLDGSMELRSSAGCWRIDRGLDRLCDLAGACGAFGRAAAAYDERHLFFSLLGMTYALDMTDHIAPVVEGAVPSGWVKDLAAEGSFAYANGVGHETLVIVRETDGTWKLAGEHDVEDWVEGVVEVGPWAIRSTPGRLSVATKQ